MPLFPIMRRQKVSMIPSSDDTDEAHKFRSDAFFGTEGTYTLIDERTKTLNASKNFFQKRVHQCDAQYGDHSVRCPECLYSSLNTKDSSDDKDSKNKWSNSLKKCSKNREINLHDWRNSLCIQSMCASKPKDPICKGSHTENKSLNKNTVMHDQYKMGNTEELDNFGMYSRSMNGESKHFADTAKMDICNSLEVASKKRKCSTLAHYDAEGVKKSSYRNCETPVCDEKLVEDMKEKVKQSNHHEGIAEIPLFCNSKDNLAVESEVSDDDIDIQNMEKLYKKCSQQYKTLLQMKKRSNSGSRTSSDVIHETTVKLDPEYVVSKDLIKQKQKSISKLQSRLRRLGSVIRQPMSGCENYVIRRQAIVDHIDAEESVESDSGMPIDEVDTIDENGSETITNNIKTTALDDNNKCTAATDRIMYTDHSISNMNGITSENRELQSEANLKENHDLVNRTNKSELVTLNENVVNSLTKRRPVNNVPSSNSQYCNPIQYTGEVMEICSQANKECKDKSVVSAYCSNDFQNLHDEKKRSGEISPEFNSKLCKAGVSEMSVSTDVDCDGEQLNVEEVLSHDQNLLGDETLDMTEKWGLIHQNSSGLIVGIADVEFNPNDQNLPDNDLTMSSNTSDDNVSLIINEHDQDSAFDNTIDDEWIYHNNNSSTCENDNIVNKEEMVINDSDVFFGETKHKSLDNQMELNHHQNRKKRSSESDVTNSNIISNLDWELQNQSSGSIGIDSVKDSDADSNKQISSALVKKVRDKILNRAPSSLCSTSVGRVNSMLTRCKRLKMSVHRSASYRECRDKDWDTEAARMIVGVGECSIAESICPSELDPPYVQSVGCVVENNSIDEEVEVEQKCISLRNQEINRVKSEPFLKIKVKLNCYEDPMDDDDMLNNTFYDCYDEYISMYRPRVYEDDSRSYTKHDQVVENTVKFNNDEYNDVGSYNPMKNVQTNTIEDCSKLMAYAGDDKFYANQDINRSIELQDNEYHHNIPLYTTDFNADSPNQSTDSKFSSLNRSEPKLKKKKKRKTKKNKESNNDVNVEKSNKRSSKKKADIIEITNSDEKPEYDEKIIFDNIERFFSELDNEKNDRLTRRKTNRKQQEASKRYSEPLPSYSDAMKTSRRTSWQGFSDYSQNYMESDKDRRGSLDSIKYDETSSSNVNLPFENGKYAQLNTADLNLETVPCDDLKNNDAGNSWESLCAGSNRKKSTTGQNPQNREIHSKVSCIQGRAVLSYFPVLSA